MIRRFCDNCREEMTGQPAGRLTRELYDSPGNVIKVQVITSWNGTWNGGDLCHSCIVQAVVEGTPISDTMPDQIVYTINNKPLSSAEAADLRERIRNAPRSASPHEETA